MCWRSLQQLFQFRTSELIYNAHPFIWSWLPASREKDVLIEQLIGFWLSTAGQHCPKKSEPICCVWITWNTPRNPYQTKYQRIQRQGSKYLSMEHCRRIKRVLIAYSGWFRAMRKFRVKAKLKKPAGHRIRQPASDSIRMGLVRDFEILADDADDAKVRAKQLLANEGYDEKLLHRAIWTVSRLDRPRKRWS